MGKSHRDNHAARKKRGPEAFAKKAERRTPGPNRRKCRVCGTQTRITKLTAGICPLCAAGLGVLL
jgi:hypothetical protein